MPITKARLKISDYNKNRKAQLSKNERRIRSVSLSLTSMVDMFAILVIFLLSNATTVSQWVEVGKGIELPKAKFSDPPPRAAAIQISRDMIFGDKKALVSVAQVLGSRGDAEGLDALRSWLKRQARKEGYVNIVAHYKVPYGVVRRVIGACQDSGFHNVNLAVQPKG